MERNILKEVFENNKMVSSKRSEKSHIKMHYSTVRSMKRAADWGRGICPLFSSPPIGIWQLKCPRPRDLPSMGKKCQCREVTPGGHGRTWNRLMHNRSDFDQSWRYRYLIRRTDARYYDFENQAPLRSTDARHLIQSTKNSTNSNSSSRWILVRKNTDKALRPIFSLFTIPKCIVEWASQKRPRYKYPDIF